MIHLNVVLAILIAHFIADFIAQSRYIAENKSTSLLILTQHTLYYTIVIFLVSVILLYSGIDVTFIFYWAAINGALHWIVDFYTSRGHVYYRTHRNIKGTIVLMGIDQLLHYICLILTAAVLFYG